MNVLLEKSKICGEIDIPPSKSQAHRMMIASFLAGENFDFGLFGDDVSATKNCLDALKSLLAGEREDIVLDAGESGSTLRFLLPVVCALGISCKIVGHGRLPMRPVGELLDVLKAHGANIVGDKLPLIVLNRAESCLSNDGLVAGEYRVTGSVSSQYITGLLFALPLLDGDSKIVIEGALVSKNYVEMTLDVLKAFGIDVQTKEYGFFVKGGQKFRSNGAKSIEGDWSSAAFPLALGLLTGDVEAKNIDDNSKQADRAFVDIARSMGGTIVKTERGFAARKSELHAVSFDASNCPDIVPVLSVLCAFAGGKSEIFGVDRLRAKESDRLLAVQNLLASLGVKNEYANNSLSIYGNPNLRSENNKPKAKISADSFADHRIAMSGIVAGLTVGGVEVAGVECIAKSYPTFLDDIKTIGAKVR